MNKQSLAEHLVMESLSDLEEELQLPINEIPKVFYLPKTNFSDTGLHQSYKDLFETNKKLKQNCVFPYMKIIFLSDIEKHTVGEEAGHFLHISLSNIYNYKRNTRDTIAASIIIETIGYFCSKIIDPDRKLKAAKMFPDPVISKNKDEIIKKVQKTFTEPIEFLRYQQAYFMGELMYIKYMRDEIPLRNIQNVIKTPLAKPNEATSMYLNLKQRLYS